MKILASLLLCMLLFAGAAERPDAAKDKDPLAGRKVVVSYYDRNGDGKVDLQKHRYPGLADADWELRDDDYDGRYEKKVRFGVGIIESAVNLAVPVGVPITKKR